MKAKGKAAVLSMVIDRVRANASADAMMTKQVYVLVDAEVSVLVVVSVYDGDSDALAVREEEAVDVTVPVTGAVDTNVTISKSDWRTQHYTKARHRNQALVTHGL